MKGYLKSPPLVLVKWLDSYTDSGWCDIETGSGDLTITYGLMINKDINFVTLAMTYVPSLRGSAPYIGNPWYIPVKMIKEIETIRESVLYMEKMTNG
tara:strand:+ start:1065 stop:1355 length:291 start_codon:yes stop_codon:yes gene_type:complete